MLNPAKLLKLKGAWDRFSLGHPKFITFLKFVGNNSMEQGTVIEITVTTKEGISTTGNLKISADDLALFDELKNIYA